MTVEELRKAVETPSHECNPPKPPKSSGDGKSGSTWISKRYSMPNECPDCYAKLQFTSEQAAASLKMLAAFTPIVANKKKDEDEMD
jgi:hypothetical protein